LIQLISTTTAYLQNGGPAVHLNYNRSRLKLIGKISLVVIGIILVTSLLPQQSAFSLLGIAFDPNINLSSTVPDSSKTSQIDADGNDVHVLWQDGVDIFLSSSTNKGASFSAPKDLGDVSSSLKGDPTLSVSGDNVYATWRDRSDSSIKFNRSVDRGETVKASAETLSDVASTSNRDVQIDSSNGNVYVIWRDREASSDNKILVRTSTNNGDTFNSIFELEDDTDSGDPKPQIASFGSNVYAIWSSSTAISFVINDNNGNNADWSSQQLLGSGGTQFNPQITTVDNFVYVVWQEDDDIKFATSTDFGVSFVTEVIGNSGIPGTGKATPQLYSSSGGSVFVVWRDQSDGDGDIKFRTKSGAGTWDPPLTDPAKDLSANTGNSEKPQVAAVGDDVYVVWRDLTNDASGEISIRASGNGGADFGGTQNVGATSDSSTSTDPAVAAVSGDHVYVSWTDAKEGNTEILFAAGTPSLDLSFDKSQYILSDTAVITVTDPDRAGDVSITLDSLTSSSDGGGIADFELTETPADSGTFVGSLTFGDATSGTTLEAKAGDTITASFDGQESTTSIFPIEIIFNLKGFGEVVDFDYGDIANIVVEDPNSAGAGQIIVNIRSTLTDSVIGDNGRSLLLTESSPNSGKFGSSSELIFAIGLGNDQWPSLGLVTVDQTFSISDPTLDPSLVETKDVQVTSSTDPIGIPMTLTETGANSNKFISENLIISPLLSNEVLSRLTAKPGDLITISSPGILSHAFVANTAVSSRVAIAVDYPFIDPVRDTVTVSYRGVSESVDVRETIAGGGGGGGLVRPGLVVNVLAGSVIFGGSGVGSKPTFGDASLLVLESPTEGFGGTILTADETSLETTQIVQTGETIELRFDLYENQGIRNLERFKMFFNFGGENFDTSTIDSHITYDRTGEITIVDPHEKLENVEIEILQNDAWNLVVVVKLVFKNTLQTSILVESWDLDRNSGKKIFSDSLDVIESSILLADVQKDFETTPYSIIPSEAQTDTTLKEIPIWVKSNALWWKQKQIDDSDFVAGIKYLIEKTIIEIDKDELSNTVTSKEMPVWIRDIAGLWADDTITDKEFVIAMQWLIKNGVLEIQQ